VGAGAAGVELLHPPRNRAAERARLVARDIDFTRIIFSGHWDLISSSIYMDRLAFFGESCPQNSHVRWSVRLEGKDEHAIRNSNHKLLKYETKNRPPIPAHVERQQVTGGDSLIEVH
jgi:hypothetical protein